MRIALYARVSTTDQSCEMQFRELRRYAAQRGWQVFDEYVDTGWSGGPGQPPGTGPPAAGCPRQALRRRAGLETGPLGP